MAAAIVAQSSSMVRPAAVVTIALSVEHALARGLQSGLDGGRKRRAGFLEGVTNRPRLGSGPGVQKDASAGAEGWHPSRCHRGAAGGPGQGRRAPGGRSGRRAGGRRPRWGAARGRVGWGPGPARRALNGHTGGPSWGPRRSRRGPPPCGLESARAVKPGAPFAQARPARVGGRGGGLFWPGRARRWSKSPRVAGAPRRARFAASGRASSARGMAAGARSTPRSNRSWATRLKRLRPPGASASSLPGWRHWRCPAPAGAAPRATRRAAARVARPPSSASLTLTPQCPRHNHLPQLRRGPMKHSPHDWGIPTMTLHAVKTR